MVAWQSNGDIQRQADTADMAIGFRQPAPGCIDRFHHAASLLSYPGDPSSSSPHRFPIKPRRTTHCWDGPANQFARQGPWPACSGQSWR
jgi:hypothetical protein